MKVHTKKQLPEPDQGIGNEAAATASLRDAFSVTEFCARMGIGRTLAYRLIAEGSIRSVVAGKRRLIPATEGRAMLERLAEKAKC